MRLPRDGGTVRAYRYPALDSLIWKSQQPTPALDRVLAFDALYLNGMLTLLMLGIRSSSTVHFDMALLIALFGFVGTVALAKFLLRGEVIEP